MIIHPLTPKLENGEICVAARVEMETPPFALPETVWFRFPEAQAHMVSENADGFAVALLLVAMSRGEDLRIRGTLSPRLAFGINEFQPIQLLRKPQRYAKRIGVTADGYAVSKAKGGKTASAFSGGVDSFMTLWSHLPQNEELPGNELAYAFFVHGMDIGLHDRQTFETCRKAYAATLSRLGVQLLTARTNVRAFDETDNWVSESITAVTAVGHMLGGELGRVYLPANDSYDDFSGGTVAVLQDALLSSERVDVVNDGANMSKFEKIVALSTIPETFDTLRVCYEKPHGLSNCCRCSKCFMAMTTLELCGALDKYKTFPLPLDRNALRRSELSHPALPIYMSIVQGAMARRRYDLATDMYIKLARNYARWGGKWVKRKLGSA